MQKTRNYPNKISQCRKLPKVHVLWAEVPVPVEQHAPLKKTPHSFFFFLRSPERNVGVNVLERFLHMLPFNNNTGSHNSTSGHTGWRRLRKNTGEWKDRAERQWKQRTVRGRKATEETDRKEAARVLHPEIPKQEVNCFIWPRSTWRDTRSMNTAWNC